VADLLPRRVDASLARREATLEQRLVERVGVLDVGVELFFRFDLFGLGLLELASGGDDIDHPGRGRKRTLEPGSDEIVQFVGVDERALRARSRGGVLAEVADGVAAVRALASDDLQGLAAPRTTGDPE
jgi:hypothetical protein